MGEGAKRSGGCSSGFHDDSGRFETEARAKLIRMAVERATHVTLSGDVSGDYVVVEKRDDGSLLVAPDTSANAILRRHNMTRATLEEFEAEYGSIQPPDGEG